MTRRLADFLGHWRLERDIAHADGTIARFEGEARWQADGEGALYVEAGTLVMPGGQRFAAERRYRWQSDMSIEFDDGRFFHRVPPDGGDTGHWCDPDQYDATYLFEDWPAWSCTWRVVGPRKNYVMTSRYSRTMRSDAGRKQ